MTLEKEWPKYWKRSQNRLLLFSVILIYSFPGDTTAQIYLQIEKFNQARTIKLSPGESLEYTTYQYPDTWVRQKIRYILPEENKIVLDEGIFDISEFKDIRFYRKWARVMGNQLMNFSTVWFVYGGIASLTSDFTFNTGDLLIGGTPLVTGFVIKKAFYKRKIRMGKNGRLRIVDLRISIPELN